MSKRCCSLPASFLCLSPDRPKGNDAMDVDRHEDAHHQGPEVSGNARPGQGDYGGRRQSVVAGG